MEVENREYYRKYFNFSSKKKIIFVWPLYIKEFLDYKFLMNMMQWKSELGKPSKKVLTFFFFWMLP